ncbi:MAG: hypothetical protein QM803_20590 [Rhodocyclaceae bacterium]
MMPIEGMFRIAALPLNCGFEQFGPRFDGAFDEVRADAQRVGVVRGGDQRDELRRRLGKVLRFFAVEEHHLFRRRALIAHLLAADFTAREERGDLVEVLHAARIDALDVARRHDLLEREIFGVEQVERVRCGDRALGHVVGRDGDVLDFDAGIGLEFLGDGLVLVHRRAQVAQHDLLLCLDVREARDRRCGGCALEDGAAHVAGGFGHDGFLLGVAHFDLRLKVSGRCGFV